MKKPDTPFPRHWLYYIALKFGLLIAGRSARVVYLLSDGVTAKSEIPP